jgi:predicted Zn finger-like uncharacterized protein
MLIVCPSCATAYRIELSTLGVNGRSVRCARCKTVWMASADSIVTTALDMPATTAARAAPPPPPPPPHASAADHDEDDGLGAWTAGEDPAAGEDEAMASVEAPSLVPGEHHDEEIADTGHDPAAAGEDIESLAARREKKARARKQGRRQRRLPGLSAVSLGLAATIAALLYWRAPIVQLLPQSASLFAAVGLPVNLRGLAFEKVMTAVEINDGVKVLVIEGAITNVTRQPVSVPRLRFALRNDAGHEIYAWTALPTRTDLAPGENLPFRTRLASPPNEGRDAIVRFFNRRDAVTGSH